MKTSSFILIAGLIAALITGCGAKQPTEIPVTGDNSPTPVVPTNTAQPPAPSPTPVTPTPIPTSQTITAEVGANLINLRAGPSMLHTILGQYTKGSAVTLLAAAPGREWLKILAADGRTGWMNIKNLTIKEDINVLPVIQINESITVTGKVVDASNKGISGIQIGVTRQGPDTSIRIDGTTGADGVFYAFAPLEYQGTWKAQILGIDCKSSIMDANCKYTGGFTPTDGIDTKLPQDTPIVFTYR